MSAGPMVEVKSLTASIRLLDAWIARCRELEAAIDAANRRASLAEIRAELAGYRAAQFEADCVHAAAGEHGCQPDASKSLKSHPGAS